MKRTLAAIVTAVLAIGLAAAGVSTAMAASNDPIPYTVDASGVTLPSPTTFPANGHVNIEYTQGGTKKQSNIHFDPNNNQPGGAWIGKGNIPWSGFGLSGNFCITWVQVSIYDEHFGEGGQAPFCVTDIPLDAAAQLSTTTATCKTGETVALGTITNATWGTLTGDTGPGTYSVTATAKTGHQFADGKSTKTFTGPLAGPSTTGCSSTPKCIADPVFTYEFDGVSKGTVTASKAGETSGSLCKPLYIRATTWTFDSPVNNGTPSWPQTLVGYNDVQLATLGKVSYTAPWVELCKQHDIYASFDGWAALTLPTKLTAPGKPSEPQFLHNALPKAGPDPTYFTSSSKGCDEIKPVATVISGLCYWNSTQKASFKTVTFEYDNSASNVPVYFEVQGWPAYNRTVAPFDTVYVSAQASWTGGVGYTVTAGGETFSLTVPSYLPCPPIVDVCTTTSNAPVSTNLNPNGWTFGETRSLGSNTYVAGGLQIETHNNSNTTVGNGSPDQRKAAGYHATNVLLSAIGVPSIAYTSNSGSLPGINLRIDKDGDGGNDGYLVYEPTLFGVNNWWSTQNLGVVSSQVIPNPSYQLSFGTLNDFLASWPNAKITAVGYSLGSGAVGAGTITRVTAGCVNYSFDYVPIDAGVPGPVTFLDVCGVTGDQVNIPILTGAEHYTYKTVDARVAGVGKVTVTAEPKAGFTFGPGVTVDWSHTFLSDAANKCVKIPGDPSTTNQVCDLGVLNGVTPGSITVVGATGLTYTIHKTDAPAVADVTVPNGKTNVIPGLYTVTAVALAGYTIDPASKSWDYEIFDRATNCQQTTLVAYDPQVTPSDPVCESDGQVGTTGLLSVDPADPLQYFINGVQLPAGQTPKAPGTYTITAVAPPGDGVTGINPFTVTIHAAALTTCGLTTLAFTGAGGTTLYLFIAAALLMAGALVMMFRRPRNAPRHLA